MPLWRHIYAITPSSTDTHKRTGFTRVDNPNHWHQYPYGAVRPQKGPLNRKGVYLPSSDQILRMSIRINGQFLASCFGTQPSPILLHAGPLDMRELNHTLSCPARAEVSAGTELGRFTSGLVLVSASVKPGKHSSATDCLSASLVHANTTSRSPEYQAGVACFNGIQKGNQKKSSYLINTY